MKALKVIFIFSSYLFFVFCIYNILFFNKKKMVKNYPYRNLKKITFLKDITYKKNEKRISEQEIFKNIYEVIENAEKFIVADMFLYNDEYDKTKDKYPEIAKEFTYKLIEKKRSNPKIDIVVITDEINNFYGSYEYKYFKELKENDIKVIVTDMKKIRDSNPFYSIFWRVFISWQGHWDKNIIKNMFNSESEKIKTTSFLKLLNFKANHRKVIVNEKEGVISSANPHDPSFYHSNIAFRFEGVDMVKDVLESEKFVADISKEKIDINIENNSLEEENKIKARLITEGRIKEAIIDGVNKTQKNDEIKIGIFYFSERKILKSIIKAHKRGVKIKIIMDANKDAFGKQKNGIPNRAVAYEMYKKSKGKIDIRWYNTSGEQFHSKFIMIKGNEETIIIGGSANFTKRNIDDYNFETNVELVLENNNEIILEVDKYFEKLWENKDAEYTLDFEKYKEKSKFKYFIYRIQEFTGLSTF